VKLQLRGRVVPDGPVICAIAEARQAGAAVAAGAHLVDLGVAGLDAVDSVRTSQPGIFVWATGDGASAADLTWDAAVARSTGAGLVCGDPQDALARGVSRESILVAAPPARAAALAADGWAVLVDADSTEAGDAEALAIAAASAWAGARVLRTRNVAAVREALDMVESIRGTRPPARTTRGLA
jgi:hypothetical protein